MGYAGSTWNLLPVDITSRISCYKTELRFPTADELNFANLGTQASPFLSDTTIAAMIPLSDSHPEYGPTLALVVLIVCIPYAVRSWYRLRHFPGARLA